MSESVGEASPKEPAITILPQDPEFTVPNVDLPILSLDDWRKLREFPPGTKLYTHPPEPARDAALWKLAFINERARTYQSKGMKIEQARIHAETDAAHGLIAMVQESGNG